MVNVDPTAIRALAAKFEAAADTLASQAGEFQAQAYLDSAAFGRLPGSRQASVDYAERLQRSHYSLLQIESALHRFATNLRNTATNWELADEKSGVG
jgi:uncharacterized protein YukE